MPSSDRFEAILELGKKLADELGDERQVSTLSRWMSHYIAELIENAKNANPETRDGKLARAADAILKLWHQNAHFANGQRPFEAFEPVMRTMESLDPDNTDYRYRHIWSPREPVKEEEKEAQKWLEAAKGLDYSARILLRLFLRQAALGAVDKTSEWVTLAARAGLDKDASIRIVRFVIASDVAPEEEGDASERLRGSAENEIERLESFVNIAAALALELRQHLSDGTYVHTLELPEVGADKELLDGEDFT